MGTLERQPAASGGFLRTWLRLGLVVGLAFLIGMVVRGVALQMEKNPRPAGLGRGLVQGIMMPCAFPTLLMGYDVPIYAERNTGVPYKLGYTAGVTVCGAVFFGVMFRRLGRWRGRGGR